MENLKVGDNIFIKKTKYSITPQWMDGYNGVVKRLNKKSVSVKLNEYPNEIHRVEYNDICLIAQ